jgi:hypothetical protein
MSMFYRILLALVVIAASAQVADAKAKRIHRYHQKAAPVWYRLSDDAYYSHCGQRSFSVSVGNPAFPNRGIWWPRPCW